jgi:hypothetical protein
MYLDEIWQLPNLSERDPKTDDLRQIYTRHGTNENPGDCCDIHMITALATRLRCTSGGPGRDESLDLPWVNSDGATLRHGKRHERLTYDAR